MEISEKKKIHNEKARARQFLFSDGNYITLVIAVMLTVAASMLSYLLAAMVSEFTYPWVATVMLISLGFLICAPMAIGAVRVAVALYCGGENPLSEVFFAFSSYGTYFKVLILSLIQGIKILVVLGVPFFAYTTISSTLYWICPYAPLICKIVAAVTAAGLFILLDRATACFYGTLFYAFADGGVSVIGGLRRSVRSCKGSFRRTLTAKLTALAFVLISAIPVCIPLLFYTVPYLLSRYVYTMAHAEDGEVAATTLTEEIIETGDINNEH